MTKAKPPTFQDLDEDWSATFPVTPYPVGHLPERWQSYGERYTSSNLLDDPHTIIIAMP